MQKSSFNFHKFSFQSYKFGFFHFSPLIFIPSQLSYNFFYIKFFFLILEKTLIKKKKKSQLEDPHLNNKIETPPWSKKIENEKEVKAREWEI